MPGRRVRPHRDCPAPERLTDLALGDVSPADRERLMSHVVGCAACTELVQILIDLDTRASAEMTPAERLAASSASGTAVPAHGAVLRSPPETFRWPSVDGATSYALVIYDAESNVVWDSESVREPSARLPQVVAQTLHAGARYYWRVFAVVGEEHHGSPPRQFSFVGENDD